jgi:hypothetical protein
VKNVGVWLDHQLNMDVHINKVNSHCYKMIKDIGRIRNVLSHKHTEMLVHAVISRLDYCNSLFFNFKQGKYLQTPESVECRCLLDSTKEETLNTYWTKPRPTSKIIMLFLSRIRHTKIILMLVEDESK